VGAYILMAIIYVAWLHFRDRRSADSYRSNAAVPTRKESPVQSVQRNNHLTSSGNVDAWDTEPYQASYADYYVEHDTCDMYEGCDSELEDSIDWDSTDYE